MTDKDARELINYFKNKIMKDKEFLQKYTKFPLGEVCFNIEAIERVINNFANSKNL